MADAATECKSTMQFHPCDTPRGMTYYKLEDLDDLQRTALNHHKLDIIRENQKYLRSHPEVGVAIKLVLAELLKSRPLRKIPEFLGKYFDTNRKEIMEKMSAAMAKRKSELYWERKQSEVASSTYSRPSADEKDLEELTMEYLAYEGADAAEESDHSEDAFLICYEIVEELVNAVAKQTVPSTADLPYTDSDPMLDFPYSLDNFDEIYTPPTM